MTDQTHRGDGLTTYRREVTALDYIHEYDVDVQKRDIYLFGREEQYADEEEPGVDYRMANRFIKNLMTLQRMSDTDPILVHMKSCGGVWEEGMAIFQSIAACPCKVTILNYTHARSMTSLILQAADRRIMLPYSTFMFHDGTFSFDGTIRQLYTETEQTKLSMQLMMDVYMDRMDSAPHWEGKSRKQMQAWMRGRMDKKEEVYLDAEQAVELGFADEIFGEDGTYDWSKIRG